MQGLSEREDADDYLQMMINPNDVYSTEAAASESPESDSGFSDDPRPETPMSHENGAPLSAPAPVYELVYDIGAMEERKVHGEMSSVISIQLGNGGGGGGGGCNGTFLWFSMEWQRVRPPVSLLLLCPQ